MKPYLSIIIPAYNEAERIKSTLDKISDFLRVQRYRYEIIVVDDGSSDDTREIVAEAAARIPMLKILKLPLNQGKGAAVKTGMLAAEGEVRLFMDADNSTSIEQVEKLLPYLRNGYDIAVGSRRIAGAEIRVSQPFVREVLGACFRAIVHFLIPLDIIDTQNGFKLFTSAAAEMLFKNLHTNGWGFDVEILFFAHKMRLTVAEVPIVWANDYRSQLRFPDMLRMIPDLLRIRLRAING